MPEFDAVVPKYLQIAQDIRNRIERGELAAGDEVESERELAVRWKVARPTAAKALNTLRQQGIVESRRGSGTYVADRGMPAVDREQYGHTRSFGAPYAEHASVRILRVAAVDPPEHVAEVLRLPDGHAAIMRKRLATTDSGPTELATSWYPAAFAATAPKLLAAERLSGGTLAYLEAAGGRRAVHGRDRVSARLANGEERELLGLPRPAAVLVYELTLYATDNTVIQFDEVVFPPGRRLLQQEYSAR
ncbi:GntR family transcriptional regulator [Nocardia arthritidis]|uniref:GntR family transcriptional regulator n=1 Tax=Nocardia arthritidis TaxID=228602 RepID=UPI00142E5A22|nr:GntR family transcriptional regulator [Nocardia arthritidis]